MPHYTEDQCKLWRKRKNGLWFHKCIRNLVSFTGALKNLKICTLRDFSVQEINVELKLQRSYVVKLKGDAIFKEKLTDCLKDDIRNFVNFHGNSRKSENLHFHGLLLSIGSKVLAKKVQKSYLSRRWRVIQTWTFVWKMTWEIWWILMKATESLKVCTVMDYFCRKKYRRVVLWKITHVFHGIW